MNRYKNQLIAAAVFGVLAVCLLPVPGGAQGAGFYQQESLVSDLPNFAQFRDKSLVNPWGLSHSPNGPWQVSDNGTGLSMQHTSVGKQVPPAVTIPTPAGVKTAAPTGNVFNSTIDFVISKNGKSFASQFIFATEDGTISGFNPNVDSTHAILAVDRSAVSQGGSRVRCTKAWPSRQAAPATSCSPPISASAWSRNSMPV
jgi:hypothetical protein